MPYALKLDLYRIVAGVLVTVIAVWPALSACSLI
jgi:hypothetical protein